jgi:hypothetical protein
MNDAERSSQPAARDLSATMSCGGLRDVGRHHACPAAASLGWLHCTPACMYPVHMSIDARRGGLWGVCTSLAPQHLIARAATVDCFKGRPPQLAHVPRAARTPTIPKEAQQHSHAPRHGLGSRQGPVLSHCWSPIVSEGQRLGFYATLGLGAHSTARGATRQAGGALARCLPSIHPVGGAPGPHRGLGFNGSTSGKAKRCAHARLAIGRRRGGLQSRHLGVR